MGETGGLFLDELNLTLGESNSPTEGKVMGPFPAELTPVVGMARGAFLGESSPTL